MEMFDLWSEGPQAYTGARHPPRTSCTTPTPGESAVMFGVIIPDPPPAAEAAMCGQAEFWSDPDCEKGHPSALNPPAGSSPVHTRIRG